MPAEPPSAVSRLPRPGSRKTRGARLPLLATMGLLALGAAACEDEITDPGDDLVEGQVTLDASSAAAYAYMTFADGGSAISPADPSTSTEWHIGFRRYAAKLNGGVAGPGSVEGYNMMNNASATEEQVMAFTPADADAAWASVTVDDIAGATFEEDGIIADESGVWFRFDPGSSTLVANPASAWKVDESGTGYAVFRVSNLTLTPAFEPVSVTIEYRHQPAGGTLGAIDDITVDLTSDDGYVDLASGSTVTPSGCNWDLVVLQELAIELNDACGAGTFPLDTSEGFDVITTAANAPEYGGFLAVLSGAFPSTIDDPSGLFWYNLDGNNRLWPTYNVFLVRVDGSAVYKVQVLDYYSTTGASGHPTIRFEQLQ